jgi:hypothetical protein
MHNNDDHYSPIHAQPTTGGAPDDNMARTPAPTGKPDDDDVQLAKVAPNDVDFRPLPDVQEDSNAKADEVRAVTHSDDQPVDKHNLKLLEAASRALEAEVTSVTAPATATEATSLSSRLLSSPSRRNNRVVPVLTAPQSEALTSPESISGFRDRRSSDPPPTRGIKLINSRRGSYSPTNSVVGRRSLGPSVMQRLQENQSTAEAEKAAEKAAMAALELNASFSTADTEISDGGDAPQITLKREVSPFRKSNSERHPTIRTPANKKRHKQPTQQTQLDMLNKFKKLAPLDNDEEHEFFADTYKFRGE